MNSPHHRRAVWALIAAGLLLGALLAAYYLESYERVEQVPQVDLADREALMNIQNQKVTLTQEQALAQKRLMDIPNSPVKLTPAQVEQQKKLMGL